MGRRRRFLAPPGPRGFTPALQAGAPVAWTSEALCLRDPWSFRSPSPFGPSSRVAPGLLRPLLTSRSRPLGPASPFQAQGEISPGKNAVLHRTTAGFTSPGPWSSRASRSFARSPCSAPPPIRFLFVGPRFRSPLPSHARSPSRSCGSLRSRWPASGRTFTSKTAPMLGAQTEKPGATWAPAFSNNPGGDLLSHTLQVQYHRRWRA